MQDILSFVQTQSPLTIAPSTGDTTKIQNADSTFSESFFSLILGELTEESKQALLDVSSNETLSTSLSTQPIEIKESDDAKSIDEHLLEDLLSVVNALKMDNQTTNFPALKASSNLEKILANENTRQEFANVQNVSDLVDLSKKYNLGLEKISISKESVESLQTKFPTLSNNNFFQDLKTALQTASADSKTTQTETALPQSSTTTLMSLLEKPIQKSDTSTTSSILSELISKEIPTTEEAPIAQLKTVSNATKTNESTSILPSTFDSEPVPVIVNEKQQETTTKVTQTLNAETTKKTITAVETVTQKVITPTETKKTETTKVVEKIIENKSPEETTSLKEAIQGVVEATSNLDDINDTQKVAKPLKESKENETTLSEDLVQTQKVKTEESYDNSTTSENSNSDIQTNTDVKVSSAKQDTPKQSVSVKETLSQFSTDLKEKIDAYKAPIMKVELSLSPKSLGDVDVTLLTRGNNLHVNISSNTNTMALFTQNQTEVKNALINMGFSNLEMNFSDQRNNDQSQQNNQKQRSGNFDTFSTDQTEEDTTLLEVVIPQYV